MDETFGGVVYILKREGVIASGPSYTVHLEVDYKKPVPASSIICCTATVTNNQGRKTWAEAAVEVRQHSTVSAHGQIIALRSLQLGAQMQSLIILLVLCWAGRQASLPAGYRHCGA